MINYCDSNPCANNGTCIPAVNSYFCQCESGFYDPNCRSAVDFCANQICLNNGTCILTANSSYCLCPEGYLGPICQIVTQLCPIDCKNGGRCTGGVCFCPQNFIGIDCSIELNPCMLNPCLNGGTCQSVLHLANTSIFDSYYCNCGFGFSGRNCEGRINVSLFFLFEYFFLWFTFILLSILNQIKKPCDSNPCPMNSICTALDETRYNCTCTFPYTGSMCERMLSLCDFINCNQGKCIASGSENFNATCICDPGYIGQYCNLRNQGKHFKFKFI
jgi:hypothetical protein